MSEHWWHDDDPRAVEARQIIFGLQNELAQAKEELTMLRAQVNRNSLGHKHQHPSRFRFIPEELTWREHEANARRMGGYLATITSSRENQDVRSAAGGRTVWIGGVRHGQGNGGGSNHWRWINGERWIYVNWNSGEPNNSGGHENSVQMYGNGKWNDVHPYQRCPAVYESTPRFR